MGMFDWVNMPEIVKCPKCGGTVDGFQTKDGKKADAHWVTGFCEYIDVSEIMDGGHVYSYCEHCGINSEFFRFTVKNGVIAPHDPDYVGATE